MPQLLKVVKKTRIPEEIVRQIHQLIRDGVLAPGERLLDIGGLVVVRPGAGTFITEDTVEAFSSMPSTEADVASDVFEMRLLLEPQVVSLAADRATEADLRRMKETLDRQEADIATGGTGVESDSQFHYAIADAAKNSALVAVTQAISDILSQSRERSLQSPERSRLWLQSHRRILACI
jgi:GntR family transcriptional repressor for pyruvate dehydrogenase complex